MNNKTITPREPIILGLAGKAATGKTSVAEAIVPKAQVNVINSDIMWDHIFFALPLYELASVKRTIQGLRQRERQLYSIHSIIYDLFGGTSIGNVPDYDYLIDLVKNIYSLPLDEDGKKPRSFLQKAGDYCRTVDENCFAKWAIHKSRSLYRSYINSIEDDGLPFCVVISDVRFVNEAEAILNEPNGILVCYEASDDIRNQRILKRDGIYMSDEQKSHISEQQIDVVRNMSSAIINTDNLSIKDQVNQTIEIVNNFVGVNA